MHGLGLRPQDPPPSRLMLSEVQPVIVRNVEKKLNLPKQYRTWYDQVSEGACVGEGYSWMMSILNRRKYDPIWLYRAAQEIDPWPDTPPEEGTSAYAGAEVLMAQGHRRVIAETTWVPRLSEGIEAVRWASLTIAVNELRTSIADGIPFGCAIPWFQNFDAPEWHPEFGWVIGRDLSKLGKIRGWHFICGYGARDSLDMFHLVNSWGLDYPLVKIPYYTVDYLRSQGGHFAIITDR